MKSLEEWTKNFQELTKQHSEILARLSKEMSIKTLDAHAPEDVDELTMRWNRYPRK